MKPYFFILLHLLFYIHHFDEQVCSGMFYMLTSFQAAVDVCFVFVFLLVYIYIRLSGQTRVLVEIIITPKTNTASGEKPVLTYLFITD